MNFEEDKRWADRAQAGDAEALESIRNEILPYCLAVVSRMCSTPRSHEKAREIVEDLMGHSVHVEGVRGPRKSLLEAYGGRTSLKAWYATAAKRRLFDWFASGDGNRTVQLDDVLGDGGEGLGQLSQSQALGSDPERERIILGALRHAFGLIKPHVSCLLQLCFFHYVPKKRLAMLVGHDASNQGRWINEALATVRTDALTRIRELDPELDVNWEDILEVCQNRLEVVREFFEKPDEPVES